jgi:hypothetical protein
MNRGSPRHELPCAKIFSPSACANHCPTLAEFVSNRIELTSHLHFAAPLICIENSQLFLGSAVIVNGFVSPYQFANVVDRGARGLQRAHKMLYEIRA